MKQVFILEHGLNGHSDATAEVVFEEDAGSIMRISQGDQFIYLDQNQRDELVQALQLLTFPGEELEDDDHED